MYGAFVEKNVIDKLGELIVTAADRHFRSD